MLTAHKHIYTAEKYPYLSAVDIEHLNADPVDRKKAEKAFKKIQLVQKLRQVRYTSYYGKQSINGQQYIDEYITNGFTHLIRYKLGSCWRYYLNNPANNTEIPLGKLEREYCKMILNKTFTDWK
jgi:hypothetical protein